MTLKDLILSNRFIHNNFDHLIRYIQADMHEANLISHSISNLSYESPEIGTSDGKPFRYHFERTLCVNTFRMSKLYGLIGNFDDDSQFNIFLNRLGEKFDQKLFHHPMKKYFDISEVMKIEFNYNKDSVYMTVERFV